MLANFYKLVYGTHTGQDGIITNGYVAGHLGIIAHDTIIANNTIMRKMAVGHDQAILSD